MAESDKPVRLVTGRQSAHLDIILKARRYERDERSERRAPGLSVVEWDVREESCQPYRIRALVSTAGPVARRDILGQLARFRFQVDEGAVVRKFAGFVSRFESVSNSRDGCTYRVEILQHLAVLDGPSNCATYQGKTSADIIQEVIERNAVCPWIRVVQRLRRRHSEHPFRFQYNMGDWAYCRLEMEQAGLFTFTEEDRHGEVVVIADDIDGYTRPSLSLKDRPPSGLHTFEESIYSLKVRTRTIPASFIVADYDADNHAMIFREEGRARDEFGTEQHDDTTMGTPLVWGTHHGDEAGAKREATLRHEAARAQQVTCRGKSTMPSIRPGCIVQPDTLAGAADGTLDAKEGLFVSKVVHRGARNENYRNTFQAIPASRPYRLPIDESKWPRVHTLGFTVTSPNHYRYPYLDAEGRIVVRFHCDFGNWPKGGESIPLRMARPFASRDHSGMNLPPVDGDFGIAGFFEGNPNKPVAVAFIPNAQNPDLINSSRRRMSRSEIRTRSGNKLWFDDWEQQQGIELSTEHSGRSQLHLGFIPDRDLNERGTGAELRTGAHLVNRGGAGVMVTAYNQPGGGGKVLAMDETNALFKDHQAFAGTLAQSAEASKATPADLDAQKGINAGLHELKKPGVLLTGPGPVAVASGDGVQLAADVSIVGTAKKGIHFSTLRRFTVAAGDLLSLFTQKGLSLITATGDFVAQAQRGRMQLASQEGLTIESVNGAVHVKAAKEIILNVNGTYVKLTGEGVEIGSRGGVLFRTTSVKGTGPAQMDLGGTAFAPKFVPYTTDCEVWRTNPKFVVPPPAPAPLPAQWEALANTGAVAPAPSLDTTSLASAGGGGLQGAQPLPQTQQLPNSTGSAGGPAGNGGLVINDPDNTNQYCVAPDPIQLQSPAPCDWRLPDFTEFARMERETPAYQKYGWTRTERIKDGDDPVMCSGTDITTCQFSYDSSSKTLTAKVVTVLAPKLLVRMNPSTGEPLRDEKNNYAVVQYETFKNGANSRKTFAAQGLMLVERDPAEVDASTYKNMIEKTLNQGNYKLILDGCQKGGACGCRIAVKFCVDVHVTREADASALNPNIVINIFPTTKRADARNWPESEYELDNSGAGNVPKVTQTKAHETGHLFNFPDEYWEQGGFVHSIYVKEGKDIDFERADANKNKNNFWIIETATNLMGGGCALPTATTSPYYLEYIRRWFSAHTNKSWRVGYPVAPATAKAKDSAASGGPAKPSGGHQTLRKHE
ncbi:type VI secretion system Vgr family protein [Paraburkholderia sp. EG287A]|uniref:type VI secretion system Vgr family protein n=1 Tax=unclassified Paraburkholderia TaxID=2615204 RepID=UPI0034D2D3E0